VFVSEVVSRSENCFRGRGKQEIGLLNHITGFPPEIPVDAFLCIATELDRCVFICKICFQWIWEHFCKIGTSHICQATLQHVKVTTEFLCASILAWCSVTF
jgi:hypothetical protein